MNKVFFPSFSENGFLYEFAAKKAFFDILFFNLRKFFDGDVVGKRKVRILKDSLPFLNSDEEILKRCFNGGNDKNMPAARKAGCPKAIIDYNIKKFFSHPSFFILEFLFELYYKENLFFFNKFFNEHHLDVGKKERPFEIYFDSGKFINVEKLGVTNYIEYSRQIRLLEEAEKIFKEKIIDKEYGKFFFKKREVFRYGEWPKSDFLIKKMLKNEEKNEVEYINIDFSQYYSDVSFLKENILSAFGSMNRFYDFVSNLSNDDSNNRKKDTFKRILSFYYDLHKTAFIVSEMQKTGDFAFLRVGNVDKKNFDERDVFESLANVKNEEYNKRILKSIITLGKPMQKIIQSGAYVYNVLKRSKRKKEPFILLKENEVFAKAYIYSLGSIYQKRYVVGKNRENTLKTMWNMYSHYRLSMKNDSTFNNLFPLFEFNPYFKAISFLKKDKEITNVKEKRDFLYGVYKKTSERMNVKSKTDSKISFEGRLFISPEEFFHLNNDLRKKHYDVFKKYLKKNFPIIVDCASPGTGKTTSVFKYCFEERKDFYYFSSRIQIINGIYDDIKKGPDNFLSKYGKDELTEEIKNKIKEVFDNIVFLTFDGNDTGLETEINGEKKEAVRVKYFLGDKVDEERIKEIIENTPIDENFVFIAEHKENVNHRKYYKKDYSEGITKKRKKGTEREGIGESGVGKAMKNLYKKTIPKIRETGAIVITAFTLQALEKSGINGKETLKAIIENKNSVSMFDEIFGSSEPKKLLKNVILSGEILSMFESGKYEGSKFVIADANIKHKETINYVINERSHEYSNNKIIFYSNKKNGVLSIEEKETKIRGIDSPVILTNSFPSRNIHMRFVAEFLNRRSKQSFKNRIFIKTIEEEYKKIKNGDEMLFVYIQNKDLIDSIKKNLISRRIKKEEIIEYHSDIETKKSPDQNTKIILATSTASRGLTFTKVKRFVILFQNFNIVSGLGELSQVIYRGRGRGNDETDKYFTFIYQDVYDKVENPEYVSAFKLYSMLTKIFITISVFSLFSGYKMRSEDYQNGSFIKNGILPIPSDMEERKITGLEILQIQEIYTKTIDSLSRNAWIQKIIRENKEFEESMRTFLDNVQRLLLIFLNESTTLRIFENIKNSNESRYTDMFNNLMYGVKMNDNGKTIELENLQSNKETINECILRIEESVERMDSIAKNYPNKEESFFRKINGILKNVQSYKDNHSSIIIKDMQNKRIILSINPVYLKYSYYTEENIFDNIFDKIEKAIETDEFLDFFYKVSDKEIVDENMFFDEIYEQCVSHYLNEHSNEQKISLITYMDMLRKKAYGIAYGVTKDSIITINNINPGQTGALNVILNIKPVNYSKSFHLFSAYYIYYH